MLFAELPLCMYPENSPAFKMKRPVFPVEKSIYGTDDAGFSWDKHAHQKLESKNFVPYFFSRNTQFPKVDQKNQVKKFLKIVKFRI